METVCHVITKLELGGAQEVALYTVSHLDRTKFRPVLVAGPGGILTEEAQRISGLETIILPSLGRQIHAVSDLVALFNLIRLFRRLRPAVVHTHSSKAGVLGRWAAWFARVPVIIHTVHGFGITPAQPAWLRRLLVLLERMTGWITTHWITVAEVDARKGRQWGLFRENISVVRPGIDPRPFQQPIDPAERNRLREEFGAGPDDYLIGTVACLKPQKAPEDYVRVANRVCAAMPQARFVLIGDGELRPRTESLIRYYRLQDRVRLAGWRRDIPAVMKSFDVLLLTSHWEGLPRVILEAIAGGIPIVSTRVGGIDEVVKDRCNARLSEAGDIAGLTTGLLKVFREREKRSEGSSNRQEELPKEFQIEEMVKQYECLYDRVLGDQREKWMPRSMGPASQP